MTRKELASKFNFYFFCLEGIKGLLRFISHDGLVGAESLSLLQEARNLIDEVKESVKEDFRRQRRKSR